MLNPPLPPLQLALPQWHRYHGWEYALSGRLTKAPRVKGIQGFRAAEWGLKPIRLDTLGPFIFLHLGGASGGSGSGGGGESSGVSSEGISSSNVGSSGGSGELPSVAEWLGEWVTLGSEWEQLRPL